MNHNVNGNVMQLRKRSDPSKTTYQSASGKFLYTRKAFLALLLRERSMALRNGHHFCLIEIALDERPAKTRRVAQVRAIVLDRTRESDVAGWFDASTLGIIMPTSNPQHAQRIAHELEDTFIKHEINSECRVHAFPLQHPQDESTALQSTVVTDGVAAILFAHVPRWKRAFDVACAVLLLVGFSPLLLLLAIGIKLVSSGPVFYSQTRIGHLGRPFFCYKFRSMRAGASVAVHQDHVINLMHNGQPLTKLESRAHDKRLIPFGALIRASGLDELPQLLNVLRGEMSIVGPRPCVPYEHAALLPWHHDRFAILPGITGLWQVSGKNHTTFESMIRFDVRYARTVSFRRDLCILLRTPLVPISQLWQVMMERLALTTQTQVTDVTTKGIRA
jgi:lipopolysaccharide/colanic/teichoic acid biosynthesis glycosyltransferase